MKASEKNRGRRARRVIEDFLDELDERGLAIAPGDVCDRTYAEQVTDAADAVIKHVMGGAHNAPKTSP